MKGGGEMLKRAKVSGFLVFEREGEEINWEYAEFHWEREDWMDEEGWLTYAIEDWLYERAEEKMQEINENIEEYDYMTEWYEYNFTKELTAYLTKYDEEKDEEIVYTLTFKIRDEEYEEEED